VSVLWITLLVVIFDQLTKLLVKGSPMLGFHGMAYGSSMPFIDDIVRITYIENPGIAFGINFPALKVFFSIFSIVASVAILWYLKKNVHRLAFGERIALSLILGGAVGNLIDRVFYGVFYGTQPLFYGRVVDFVDFGLHRNMFPVFNVADSAVTVGVILLLLIMMFKKPVVTGPENASFVEAGSSEAPAEGSTIVVNQHPDARSNAS
jgi:signal peptidase II